MKLSEYYFDRFDGLKHEFEPKIIKNIAKSVKQINGYEFTENSAEFLDPVFSSGVTFATESAITAARLIVKDLKNETVNWKVEYSD
jgi:hypothetical protein